MAEFDEISRVQRPFSLLFLLIFLIYLARALAILCKLDDFQTCFDKKYAYLQLMTSIIYRLDIALAAPKKIV